MRRTLAGIAIGALVLAGCGGSGSDDAATTTTAAAPSEADLDTCTSVESLLTTATDLGSASADLLRSASKATSPRLRTAASWLARNASTPAKIFSTEAQEQLKVVKAECSRIDVEVQGSIPAP